MSRPVAVVGTDAVAEAMRQIEPDVVAAYPITPQTAIVETFATMVANGEVKTEMINVESEHSAMSACIGAASGGARVMTCTSSQGLGLMWEMLYIASGLRLPIVMPNVNRALSAPINIHCDHSDSMGARDSGWIQIFSENAQEAYENTIQAARIAEHPDVLLPAMVLLDGFIISHGTERAEFYDDEKVREFVGEYKAPYTLLDSENPITVGSFDGLYGYFFEFKRAQEQAMHNALPVVKEVGEEFGKKFGSNRGYFETYQLEDAEVAFVALGSGAGTTRAAVQQLRKEGVKAGMLKLRLFRPFPEEELVKALSHVPVVAVLDRSLTNSGGPSGPVCLETMSAFYNAESKPTILSYIYGLGGRDFNPQMVKDAAYDLVEGNIPQGTSYLGLKEEDN